MCVRVEPWPEIFYALVLLPQSMQGKAAGQHGYCDHCVWFKKELKKFSDKCLTCGTHGQVREAFVAELEGSSV